MRLLLVILSTVRTEIERKMTNFKVIQFFIVDLSNRGRSSKSLKVSKKPMKSKKYAYKATPVRPRISKLL